MKRWLRHLVTALVLTLLLSSCSNKGVHMSKHRRSRHCDCPTFSQAIAAQVAGNATTLTL